MSKKTCFLIYVIALPTLLISYIINFSPITKEANQIFSSMQNIYLAATATLLSLLLKKQKHYLILELGLSVITAIILQLFIIKGTLISLATLYLMIAYMVYNYLTIQIRYML